jgi:phosphate transport system permease protein
MKARERALAAAVHGAAFFVFLLLLCLAGFILARGIPHLKPSLFALAYTSDNVSLMPALLSTVLMACLSLLFAAPLGIGAAIWLVEYARRGSRLVFAARLAAETLAGIPSIIHGLFGMLFFVSLLGWGFSLLAGACTLSIMALPLILRAAEEALSAVPGMWREAAFGLGAGKLRMLWRIALPAAAPGILAGIVLALGRIVGETAALLYTAGTVAQLPLSPMDSARTLSVHMYALSSEGLHVGEGYATAIVLLLLVIGLNAAAAWVAKKIAVKEEK